MVSLLTKENVEEIVRQVDLAFELSIKESYKLRKKLTHKQWRSRNTKFRYEFKVSSVDFWDIYCYIKYNSKHCWVTPDVETTKSYRFLTMYAFV